jgi:hypothetical protein
VAPSRLLSPLAFCLSGGVASHLGTLLDGDSKVIRIDGIHRPQKNFGNPVNQADVLRDCIRKVMGVGIGYMGYLQKFVDVAVDSRLECLQRDQPRVH